MGTINHILDHQIEAWYTKSTQNNKHLRFD